MKPETAQIFINVLLFGTGLAVFKFLFEPWRWYDSVFVVWMIIGAGALLVGLWLVF